MSESLGIVAAFVHSGSMFHIHAAPDHPAERRNMGAGHMGWYGSTLCGLKGSPWEGMPFMRPVNGRGGRTFADWLADPADHETPCKRCRAEFNKRQAVS